MFSEESESTLLYVSAPLAGTLSRQQADIGNIASSPSTPTVEGVQRSSVHHCHLPQPVTVTRSPAPSDASWWSSCSSLSLLSGYYCHGPPRLALSFSSGSEGKACLIVFPHSKTSSGWGCVPHGGTNLTNSRLCILGVRSQKSGVRPTLCITLSLRVRVLVPALRSPG